jgi:eukaryotic-like serine/threonine-protein kinase
MSERPQPEQPPDPLDAGLAAAFGPDSGPPIPLGASVLQALTITLPEVPRVHLSEAGAEPEPPVHRPHTAEMPGPAAPGGRYQLHGEIARGGMDVILKGRDTGLGRDVAVKVLLETHQGKTELLQRFVEEAQIGGQLQHPGIVPVYDLGQLSDRRPYFTMKLVKGRTLAAQLYERADPARDRGRFLKVFEQVCQTLAYAHARGVIHRDLKPANVMVGAFGEVQVMDWGLAKVIPQGGVADERKTQAEQAEASAIQTARGEGAGTAGAAGAPTQAGSVLGTPAYMAPEQARGEVSSLDERCDVFGLGAILCEILTGKPPYTGGDRARLLRQASAGDLADARARLGGCGADAELVALAQRCLAPERSGRPRHAGEVAAAVTGYLQSVEARLRRAEAERAAAQVKAQEERKRRRLTLALAAALLLLVLGGSGGLLWVYHERAERAERAAAVEREVNAALHEASLLQQRSNWAAARAELRRVEGLLGAVEGHDDLRGRVRELASDLDMVERLEEIRLQSAGAEERGAAEYEAAFRAFGIDLGALQPAEAAKEIERRAIRTELVDALEQWALMVPAAEQARLLEVARAAAPETEGALDKFRQAAARKDMAALRRLAAAVQVTGTRPARLVQLSLLLFKAGAEDEAVKLLRKAQTCYPGDFWINHQLAFYLMRLRPVQAREAVDYYRAALALRPDSPGAYVSLGDALWELGHHPEARAAYREAIRLDPALAPGLLKKGRLER